MDTISSWISTRPAGLIELGGTATIQISLTICFGIYYYVTAPSEQYRKTLLLPVPVLAQNIIFVYFVNFMAITLVGWYKGLGLLEYSFSEVSAEWPGVSRATREILGAVALFEVFFYIGHRAMHLPGIYKAIHAVHHRFENEHEEVPLSVFYAHPLESLYAYSLVVVGAGILGSHVFSLFFSGSVATAFTMYLHTGNDIPGIMGHDTHHKHPMYNFGALGVLDSALGTLYKAPLGKQRPSKDPKRS